MKRYKPLKRSPIKRSSRKTVPKEIRDHWSRVSMLGCVICGSAPATIHHVHGGSIREHFGAIGMPGMGQKQNDWLVIPLAPQYHTGNQGIDNGLGEYKGVVEWEVRFGRQADFLEEVRRTVRDRFGYDIYERAGGPFLASAAAAQRGDTKWGVDLASGADVTVVSVSQSVLAQHADAGKRRPVPDENTELPRPDEDGQGDRVLIRRIESVRQEPDEYRDRERVPIPD